MPAALILVALLAGAWRFADLPGPGRDLSLSLLLGTAFGVVLQRSRFCFYCIARDYLQAGETAGLYAILAALAVGTLGYLVVFGAFLPLPSAERLPPGAHIGPVSFALVLGAFVFGVGMAVSGSCISAHFYRLGEGATASPFALLGAVLGFVLGFLTWNPIYLALIQDAPVVWLPRHLGYGGTALLQLALLLLIVVWIARRDRPVPAEVPPATLWEAVAYRRWPPALAGALVGAIGVVAYLRLAPLGVTAELGSVARTAADQAGWLPARLHGLDGFAGCATLVKEVLWSNNGVFVLGLVSGAWAAALNAGAFKPRRPQRVTANFVGGVLMGWGGMTALGCTVGTLLSGIMAGALSGWIFGLACLAGIAVTLRLKRG
ncbi:putative membrane protein [Bordetella avium 197N]|uniref:Membrane protein n=1 Tax=Bordetella avium (strain 197N) TaxID=360910 RepID=Q2L0R4_BORA1|nr:putative membrane protein [Bordetella avium 197N]